MSKVRAKEMELAELHRQNTAKVSPGEAAHTLKCCKGAPKQLMACVCPARHLHSPASRTHVFVSFHSTQDRTIDGLRDMLATNKRSYEGRIAQLEDALHAKTSQVSGQLSERQRRLPAVSMFVMCKARAHTTHTVTN